MPQVENGCGYDGAAGRRQPAIEARETRRKTQERNDWPTFAARLMFAEAEAHREGVV